MESEKRDLFPVIPSVEKGREHYLKITLLSVGIGSSLLTDKNSIASGRRVPHKPCPILHGVFQFNPNLIRKKLDVT